MASRYKPNMEKVSSKVSTLCMFNSSNLKSIGLPNSCLIPTLKEILVRVEYFSKIRPIFLLSKILIFFSKSENELSKISSKSALESSEIFNKSHFDTKSEIYYVKFKCFYRMC